MIKKTIKKIVNIFGYDFKKFNKKDYDLSLDEILKKKLPTDPIIFDVGANKGQSIEKYLKLFKQKISSSGTLIVGYILFKVLRIIFAL